MSGEIYFQRRAFSAQMGGALSRLIGKFDSTDSSWTTQVPQPACIPVQA